METVIKCEKQTTTFKFDINEKVHLVDSLEGGIIVGRAEYAITDKLPALDLPGHVEYASKENEYLLLYVDAGGCLQEIWWRESALLKSLFEGTDK